jgi:hypothetical protein
MLITLQFDLYNHDNVSFWLITVRIDRDHPSLENLLKDAENFRKAQQFYPSTSLEIQV